MNFGLIAELDNSRISLPLQHVEARFRVTGDLASVEMDQVFEQNARKALDVTYTFPLPGEASVFRCEMHVNDRVVRAIVMEEKEARRVVAEKKAQGHRTALVESIRDNLFTLELGNVAPGDRIVIRFAYLQPLERLGDQISLRVPFTPGVRYIPGKPLLRSNRGSGVCDDTDEVPDASRLSPPRINGEHPDAATIYVRGTLDADEVQAGSLNSPSHSVQVDADGKYLGVELAGEQHVPDRDWVLRWQEALVTEAKPKAWSCRQDEWRYGLVQLRAPLELEAVEQFPQDVYFLLDRSRSMEGARWEQCAKALKAFVRELSPVDRIWITCFEYDYQDFSNTPMLRDELLADPAFQNFEQIKAHGGTELLPALKHVLEVRAKYSQGVPSRLILITDGQVGNEEAILKLMRNPEAAQLPVHTFGIDRAINDAFLQQLAADTGGRCTLMTPQDDIPGAVRKLACTLRRPVLTHLQLSKGSEMPRPERGLMDLHAGEVLLVPVRVQGSSRVELTARQPHGHPWSMKWDLDGAPRNEAARLVWVKRRIEILEQEGSRAKAIKLAINHNLVCQGASFVAWDETAKTAVAELGIKQPSFAEENEPIMKAASIGPALPREVIMHGSLSSELMTVKETSEYLRIPLPTVYYLVQRGQLPAVQIGGRWRIKRSLLDRDVLHNHKETGQPTVMVVDDDPALQAFFNQFLKKAGFRCLVVGTGAEAISSAKKQKFDFVFLDLKLPDVPGDEVYSQLKELYPDLPIVIITGYPDSEVLTRILSHGPVTVIKKPLNHSQLNEVVKQLGHKKSEALH